MEADVYVVVMGVKCGLWKTEKENIYSIRSGR